MSQRMADLLFELSPYAIVGWENGEVRVRSLLASAGITGDDAVLLQVLHAFASPRTVSQAASLVGLEEVELGEVADALLDVGVLTTSPVHCAWQPSDLAFHEASTPLGSVKRIEANPIPAERPAFPGPRIGLARAPVPAPNSLASLLRDRRSIRQFGERPMALERFATLLDRSLADRGDSSESAVRRPYPSGGATYSLEVYPVIQPGAVEGLSAGLYHYASATHELELLSNDQESTQSWAESARSMMGRPPSERRPPIVLLVTSRFLRVAWSYRDVAYRLVIAELGCLIQTVYLVAQELGLGACALGGVVAGPLLELAGLDPLDEPLIGELALGPLA